MGGLSRWLAWKITKHGFDTHGRARLVSRGGPTAKYSKGHRFRTKRIVGHRRTNLTECPGDGLNRELDTLRRRVQNVIDKGGGKKDPKDPGGGGIGVGPLRGDRVERARRPAGQRLRCIPERASLGLGAEADRLDREPRGGKVSFRLRGAIPPVVGAAVAQRARIEAAAPAQAGHRLQRPPVAAQRAEGAQVGDVGALRRRREARFEAHEREQRTPARAEDTRRLAQRGLAARGVLDRADHLLEVESLPEPGVLVGRRAWRPPHRR